MRQIKGSGSWPARSVVIEKRRHQIDAAFLRVRQRNANLLHEYHFPGNGVGSGLHSVEVYTARKSGPVEHDAV